VRPLTEGATRRASSIGYSIQYSLRVLKENGEQF